jgi:hypothetical protein
MNIKRFFKFTIAYNLHCFVNKFYINQKTGRKTRPYLKKLNDFLADLWLY